MIEENPVYNRIPLPRLLEENLENGELGISIAEMAVFAGCNEESVMNWLKRQGVKRRPGTNKWSNVTHSRFGGFKGLFERRGETLVKHDPRAGRRPW